MQQLKKEYGREKTARKMPLRRQPGRKPSMPGESWP